VTTTLGVLLASESGEPSPLVPHLSELIVGLVAFTLLFLFLRAKVFPVFERVFRERSDAIEGSIEKAAADRAEAKVLLERYQAQLADARGEAGRIRTEAQSQRAEIVEEARVEARAEAQRILESATAQIASERQQALAELRREVGTLAVDLASRVVGESLQDDARRNGTVERYLAELEGTAGREPTARTTV
jgi:F-type H+-transporting ATPase subunit b